MNIVLIDLIHSRQRLACLSLLSIFLLAFRIISSLLLRKRSALSFLLSDHEPLSRLPRGSLDSTGDSAADSLDFRLYRVMRSGWSATCGGAALGGAGVTAGNGGWKERGGYQSISKQCIFSNTPRIMFRVPRPLTLSKDPRANIRSVVAAMLPPLRCRSH